MRYVAIRFSSFVRSIVTIFAALAMVAVMSAPAMAQSTGSGSIVGVAKDSKGGVLVGATVTIADPSIGASQTMPTGSDGEFAFASIPPGDYSITVDATGFKTSVKTDIHVPVDSKIDVGDVVLEVGAVSETVTVRAEGGQLQLQTQSGERSGVLSNEQLRNLQLLSANATDLLKIIPGVVLGGQAANSALSAIGNLNINGAHANQKQLVVDGLTNYNVGNDTSSLVTVNIDALSEIKVETSSYSPEYGRSGGGYIALETKSGTSEYHGGASYFRRNQTMNADSVQNDWMNAVLPTPYDKFPASLYDYNYYGWHFGGPVWIPKVFDGKKHKLFFFIDQEYYRQLVPVTSPTNIVVPTAMERAGNFSESYGPTGSLITIKNPCTGTAFAGNIIPVATINPCTGQDYIYAPGQSVLNALPMPQTGTNCADGSATPGDCIYNYTSELSNAYPRTETILRGDYQMSDSARLSVSWVHNYDDQQFHLGTTTAAWNFPLASVDRFNGPGNVMQITLNKNFGTTWTNESTFGETRGHVNITVEGSAATSASTGIDTPLLYANPSGLSPEFIFSGFPSGESSGASISDERGPFFQNFLTWQVMDNLTKVAGRHIFKFGLYIESSSNSGTSQTNTQSTINFGSNQSGFTLDSGDPFANAVLGVYDAYSQATQQVHQNYLYHDVSGYAEDTWKVSNNLTLDLGVRISWYQPTYDKGEPNAIFNPADYSAAMAPQIYYPVCVGAVTCTSGQSTYRAIPLAEDSSAATVSAAAATATLVNTQPGYDVGRLVPGTGSLTNGLVQTPATLGYPVSGLNTPAVIVQPRIGYAWDAGGHHNTVVRGGFGIFPDRYKTESCGATNPPFITTPNFNNGYLQTLNSGVGALSPFTGVCGFGEAAKFPTVYNYNTGVQKNIGAGTVIDVSYVGMISRHLLRQIDSNAVPYGTDFQNFAQNPTVYPGGQIPANENTAGSCPNNSAAQCALYPEYVTAGANFMADTILPSSDFVRPYAGYDSITYYTFDGNAFYNSLQVNISRQFLKTLTFSAAYTLSQVKSDTVSEDTATNQISDQRFDYQLAPWDHKNLFVASFVWDMPGLARMMGENKVASVILNHWTLAGFTTLESGSPLELTPSLSSGGDFTTRVLGTPSETGDAARFFLNGKPQYGTAAGSINASAFVVPQIGQIGPYPRTYARNPGLYNEDLSIYKNIPFGESGVRYIQLRLEAYNAFNHPEYSGYNLSTAITNAAGNTSGTTGPNSLFANYNGLTITNAAHLRGTNVTSQEGTFFNEYSGANSQRVVQIGAKFYF